MGKSDLGLDWADKAAIPLSGGIAELESAIAEALRAERVRCEEVVQAARLEGGVDLRSIIHCIRNPVDGD